jgi:hypothetical protein
MVWSGKQAFERFPRLLPAPLGLFGVFSIIIKIYTKKISLSIEIINIFIFLILLQFLLFCEGSRRYPCK